MNPKCQQIIDLAGELNQDLGDTETALSVANATIASLEARIKELTQPPDQVVYSNLHLNKLFPADKKIPFQWIQPGNVGNTGGGSSLAHGTSTWTPGSPTLITITPKNIAPHSDNFFFYMVLPQPHSATTHFRFHAGNFSARSAADWLNSQAFEFQLELIEGGWRYNMAWQIQPIQGLRYFDKTNSKWIQYKGGGIAPILTPLNKPTSFIADFTIDRSVHTTTHVSLQVNDTFYPVAVTQPASMASPTQTEFSVAVQLDSKSTAPPYAAVLDQLEVRHW